MIAKALLVLSLIYFIKCEKFRFDNYSLYKIYPQNEGQTQVLQTLYTDDERFDFWSEPVANAKYVMVLSSPDHKYSLESVLNENDMGFEITISNIQENIDNEPIQRYSRQNSKMQWNAYYSLDEINAWMDDLIASFPNIVSPIVGGETYEKRQIRGIKISHGPNKRIVVLEGGLHAREWITIATVNYITNELLTSTDKETMAYAREFDWYIFPVANPDGYAYSFDTFRMWRKNRRPLSGTNVGVDLNRNWDHYFGVHHSSTNESSDTYGGPHAFSEPETKTYSEYIRSIGDKVDLYLSFHSFGQLLLIPFGNTTEPLANYHDAINIGRRAMGAMSVRHGTLYTTGNIAEAIYLATGGSVDWIKDQVNIPLVYCYELRDKGTHGFLLPPEQILDTSQETMDSVKELIYQAKRFGYLVTPSSGSSVGASVLMMLLVVVRCFV